MRPVLTAPSSTAFALPGTARDAERLNSSVAAIEGNGCILSLADAGMVFPAPGFAELSETREIFCLLENEGRLIREQDAITVISAACPAPEDAADTTAEDDGLPRERIDAFVALLPRRDCDITIGEAPRVFPANGFDEPAETRDIEDLLEIDQENGVIRLIGDACPA